VEVAALDYERDFFVEARWGWVYLDYRPIQSIERFFFSYPGTAFAQSYNVPVDWLQADPKFARVQIVPTHGEAIIASFNAWVLSVLAGGRGLPQSIYVDYTAGLSREKLLAEHQDLLELVRIRTTLGLFPALTNIRTGGLGSRSLSLDGLSRSESYGAGKWGAYSGVIEQYKEREKAIVKTWRESERGVLAMVL